jgi:hypothetical protein
LHYFTELELRNFNSSGILYGVIAMDAWKDADLPIVNGEEPDWDSGTILEQERQVSINFVKAFIN